MFYDHANISKLPTSTYSHTNRIELRLLPEAAHLLLPASTPPLLLALARLLDVTPLCSRHFYLIAKLRSGIVANCLTTTCDGGVFWQEFHQICRSQLATGFRMPWFVFHDVVT